ncbi:MAG: polysaccharide deacetylase family protein [Armatimonadota bacterium]
MSLSNGTPDSRVSSKEVLIVSRPRVLRHSRRVIAIAAAVPLFTGTIAGLSGCAMLKNLGKTEQPKAVPTAAVKKGPTPPDIDYAAVRPNELGRIPVIMYHEIGDKPDRRDPALVRTPVQFRKDLQTLYDAGFLPVNLNDIANNSIDIPAGKSPVVLTFDDARGSQFKLIETENAMKIDPNSALGIMDAFHKEHPEWAMRGTFFILPKSKATMEPFGQVGLGNQKIAYLLEQGMEIGNHTTLHKSLRRMTAAQIQEEIGNANNSILAVAPEAKITAFAVPMGQFPHDDGNLKYLMHGTFDGKPYDHKMVMAAAYRPIPSPAATDYNPGKLERIAPIDGLNGADYWIKKLKSGSPYPLYISDGDPNVISYPKGDDAKVNVAKLEEEGKLANAYSAFGGSGGAKPIVSADEESPSASDGSASKPIVNGDTSATVTEKPISGG